MFKEGTQRGRCQQVKNQREERWVQVKERINPVSGRNHEMDQDRHTISASARSFLLHRPWHIFSIFSKQRAYLEGTVPDPLVSWRHDCEASFASNFNTDIGVFVGAEFSRRLAITYRVSVDLDLPDLPFIVIAAFPGAPGLPEAMWVGRGKRF